MSDDAFSTILTIFFVVNFISLGLGYVLLRRIYELTYTPEVKEDGGMRGKETAVRRRPSPDAAPPVVTETCEVIPESEDRVPYKCGHEGWKTFRVSFWGEENAPNPEYIAKREKCAECMIEEAMRITIRCARCGFIIGPGDPVALYADDDSYKTEWTTRHKNSVIGCMRWDCCPSGGFHAGAWNGTRFIPAYEHGSAAAQAFTTGEVVVAKLD